MNTNFIINIRKNDYFALRPEMRQQSDRGAMVLTVIKGKETFVPVNMLE